MKRKRSNVGCLFWVALILLVVVVFLFNRPKIAQVLKSTGLTTLVTKKPQQPSAPTVTRTPRIQTNPEVTLQPKAPASSGRSTRSGSPTPTPSQPKSLVTQKPPTSTLSGKPAAGTEGGAVTSSKAPSKVLTRHFDLYFVKVSANGQAVVTPTTQAIEFVDSPLTKTFDSLLHGVSSKDRSNGLRSLIPAGTKLLSASVRNGTAYLDFNDRFRFNPYGVQGYDAQLKQVVFTATQFQTVQRVQILLNGKVRRFLASEGIPIDKPLDRTSFPG